MLTFRRRLVPVVPVLVLSVIGLAGCSGSGGDGDGGLSLADKAKTVQLCVDVATSAKSAADIGTKVANGAITQAEAVTALEPIASHVTTLADENAALPIGKNLKKLSDSMKALQKVDPNTPTGFQKAADTLAAESKAVLADCTAIGN